MMAATRALSSFLSPQIGTSSSRSASGSPHVAADTECSADTTVTPSGTISCACSAAEPCGTPSSRVALPDTAAASGTVASTRICPAVSASLRLVRFSDWARNGTVRNTTGPRVAASAFSAPWTSAPSTCRAHLRGGLLRPAGVARADHHRVPGPGQAQRQAPAQRAGAADDGNGVHAREPIRVAPCGSRARWRWSPAAPAASAPPPASAWQPRAQRWPRPTWTAPTTRWTCATRLGREGGRRDRVRSGPGRHPGQQRGHRRRRLLHPHRRGPVGPRHSREPARRAGGDPRRAAGDARAPRRLDRERGLRGRAGGLAAVHRLLGHQGRGDRVHQGAGQGVGALRRARERGGSRADRHRHAQGGAGRARRARRAVRAGHGRTPPRWAARAGPRRWPRRSPSWPATTRRSSRARRSASAVVWG